MNKPKLLLIEDNEDDYNFVQNFFAKYKVDFYPKDVKEHLNFSRKLIKFSRANSDRKALYFEGISDYISKIAPDIILLDLGLDGVRESIEKQGLEIIEWIRNHLDPNTKIIVFSRHENYATIDKIDGYIQKQDEPMEAQLEEQVIKLFNIDILSQSPAETDTALDNKDGENKRIEYVNAYSSGNLNKFKVYDYKFLSPFMSLLLDKIITYIFYILILILFVLGPIDIIRNSGKLDSFKIAERAFIAFLPFLIVCGFYIFYKKSLRAYFFKEIIDPRKEDFESSSVLMKLTKKLFVSSLLSYLFIKSIELLCFEKPTLTKNYFLEFYNVKNPFIQLYLTGGLMIVLISYYIYIDKNHAASNNNHKKEVDTHDTVDPKSKVIGVGKEMQPPLTGV